MTSTHRAIAVTAALVPLLLAGCVAPNSQARKDATARWQQVRGGLALQMAEQQLQSGQVERARTTLDEALRANPDDPRLQLLLGRVHIEMRDLAAAQAAVARARTLAPELPEADYWYGVLAQTAGQWDEAEAAYQAAYAKSNASVEYLCALLETKLARAKAAEAAELAASRLRDFPREPRLRVLAGQAALLQDDTAGAEAFYQQAVDIDPASPEIQEALADALCRAGKHSQAAALLERLLAGQPDRNDLRLRLIDCHLHDGRGEQAERLCEDCLKQHPDRLALHLRLCEARLLAGRTAEARRDLADLSRQNPRDAQVWELLGHACALDGDLVRAHQAYTAARDCGGQTDRLEPYIDAIERRAALTESQAALAAWVHQGNTPAVARTQDEPHR